MLIYIYIMARTSWIRWWWCPLCSWPTPLFSWNCV